MNKFKALPITIAALCSLYAAEAPANTANKQVVDILSKISEQQIASTQQKLESFQTRNIYSSQIDPQHGIGAARHWIYSQFQSYSPRLQVSFDEHGIKAFGRVYKDVKIFNVVAVLPGSSEPERHVVVSGHYDSMNMVFKTGANGKRVLDPKATVAAFAPGVTDDGSGTAAVLELARVTSQYQFRKTIIFIAFAGEEYGLLGSFTYADAAKRRGDVIEGVLNNDIIGSDQRGDGSKGNRRINVYSEDPNDSPSRQLARYVRETASHYLPEMEVNLVFRHDRFGRGGDHSPFNANDYAAIRFTTPWENFGNQHTATDTFANTAPAFTTLVTKVNAAALASLALAPKTPQPVSAPLAPGRTIALPLGRGTAGGSDNGYDAEMHWINANPEPDLAGYSIVIRDTKSPDWEREIFVGNVSEYTIKGLSIDEVVLGVRAVDRNGNESLVAAYVDTPYKQRKWETF